MLRGWMVAFVAVVLIGGAFLVFRSGDNGVTSTPAVTALTEPDRPTGTHADGAVRRELPAPAADAMPGEPAQGAATPSEPQSPTNIVPAGDGPLRVRVIDEDGDAAPSARVALYRQAHPYPIVERACDGAGWTDLPEAQLGDRLVAEAPGYAPSTESTLAGPPAGTVILRVAPGVVLLHGIVVNDANDGVPDVLVSVNRYGVWSIRARTDAQGRFELRDLADRGRTRGILEVVHPDYHYPHTETLPRSSDGGVILRVTRFAILTIHPQDDQGQPIRHAIFALTARLDRAEPPQINDFGEWVRHADPINGLVRYENRGVPPGVDLRLAMATDGHHPGDVRIARLAPTESRELHLQCGPALPPPHRFLVLGPDGVPVSAGVAQVRFDKNGDPVMSGSELAAGGRFEVARGPARFNVRVIVPGCQEYQADHEAQDLAELTTLALLASVVELRVEARAEDGTPVADEVVIAVASGDGKSFHERTDDLGQAVFRSLSAMETYTVTLGAEAVGLPGNPHSTRVAADPVRHDIRAGGDPVAFRMVAPASVSGRVAGSVTAGQTAALLMRSAPDRIAMARYARLTAEGGFSFDRLTPGSWDLHLEGADHPACATFHLAAGEQLRDTEVEPR